MRTSQCKRTFGGLVLLLFVAGVAGSSDAADSKPPVPRWRDTSDMVFVRGGQFAFGGREVRVRSFYMDRHEVTNGQYCAFLNADAAHVKHWNDKQEIEKQGGKFVVRPGKERWPVCFVNWHDAEAYARWTGKRLPTESEWEWAAGGPEGGKYPWGNAPLTTARANFGENVGHPQPVGSYEDGKNALGIYDQTGNVAEWCLNDLDYTESRAADQTADQTSPHAWRGGCWIMTEEHQGTRARSPYKSEARVPCIGFRCVRPARRVLVLLGENFAELEFGAYTAVLAWAAHTTPEGDYMMPKTGAPNVPAIEVIVAGFTPEVRGMGSMTIRPHVLVQDLTDEEIDRFDAVAVPACVGSGRGQHTYRGWEHISGKRAAAIIRRVHANGGIISTMCAGRCALKAAGLAEPTAGPDQPVAYDPELRTATSVGPAVAVDAACMLLKQLVRDDQYRSFRRYNPWLFGGQDQFPPRMKSLR